MIIPFNIPYTTGKEINYIKEVIDSGHVSGNGNFTKLCLKILDQEWGLKDTLLTTSCTDALEMAAMLLEIKPGNEVIIPAYTFVSTALAFTRQGASIVFADSRVDNPCIDEKKLEPLINERTKAIIPVHYGGLACEMDAIIRLAEKYGLWVVEDAAHAFGARYKGRLLGNIGHLGCFSFHETKIIHCGEGGMLSINDERFSKRAEIIWEKGTDRCAFQRGEVEKYEWIDTGSSFLMSDINAAFLYSQLLETHNMFHQRKIQWELYSDSLKEIENKGFIKLAVLPENSEFNYSGFFIITRDSGERGTLINKLKKSGIQALTHYLDLGESPYIKKHQRQNRNYHLNPNSKKYQDTILRLPLYYDLSLSQINEITEVIKDFYLKISDE